MRIRPTSNVYHIAIVASDETRDRLCEALRVNPSEVRERFRTVRTPQFQHLLDVSMNGETRQLSLMVHFYNPTTFARDLIGESRLDASVFAVDPKHHSEVALIGAAASGTLTREENILVRVITHSGERSDSEQTDEAFKDFPPDNHFDLTTENRIPFTEKLCAQLERLRLARTALSAAYHASVSEESFWRTRGDRDGDSHPALAHLLSVLGIHRASPTSSLATASPTTEAHLDDSEWDGHRSDEDTDSESFGFR